MIKNSWKLLVKMQVKSKFYVLLQIWLKEVTKIVVNVLYIGNTYKLIRLVTLFGSHFNKQIRHN